MMILAWVFGNSNWCQNNQRIKQIGGLGWNGERLARNHDAGLLYEDNREVFEWVVSTLTEFTKRIA
jgi:hypothetical protein